MTELVELLWDRGIQFADGAPPPLDASRRLLCPECGGGRSRELSLSVTLKSEGGAVWHCFRATCGWSGGVRAPGGPALGAATAGGGAGYGGRGDDDGEEDDEDGAAARPGRPPRRLPDTSRLEPLSPELLAWFAARGISRATLERNRVRMARGRFAAASGAAGAGAGAARLDAVAFPYLKDGVVVNVKFRVPEPKAWSQTKGGEQVLYGHDEAAAALAAASGGARGLIVVEGELDKLALNEAGLWNVVSVPSGALPPRRVGGAGAAGADAERRLGAKFAFLKRSRRALDAAERVLIATDADAPGQALAEALARHLGRGRCWLLRWPPGVKDANEALLAMGREALVEYVRARAELMPAESLV